MYWPRMSADLKDYMARCDVCLAHRDSPPKETLLQHELTSRPWAKVGADLCELDGRTLLIVVDYFSGFIEVERLTSTTSTAVSKALKIMCARYGVPNVLVTDNGPQFDSAEFAAFAAKWGFQHVTSSPRYPQSNGKVENAVKTVKRLFTKCRESHQSEYQALLDWRNTPTEGIGSSPAQRFLGRRCRTLLPTTEALLQPEYNTMADSRALIGKRAKQAYYYNRQARDLPSITVGETVRLRLPGDKQWTAGVCTGTHGPRSYIVRVGEAEYRRNRRHVLKSGEPPTRELDMPTLPAPRLEQDQPVERQQATEDTQEQGPENNAQQSEKPSEPRLESVPTQWLLPEPPQLRRSTRQRKQPDWITSYVPS